jgi:predicted Zn-ribbon and HTH transcriptional regulator
MSISSDRNGFSSQGRVVVAVTMPSRRERIKELLKDSKAPLSAEDIIAILSEDTNVSVIYEDLQHVAKSVRATSKGSECLAMFPPTCKACGFTFRKLKKPKRPSHCPKCKSERVNPPQFKIVSR